MEVARREVEDMLRKVTKTPSGRMKIRRLHVDKVLRTNKSARRIGKPRADIVWACVAHLVTKGGHVTHRRPPPHDQHLGLHLP
jgi:ribosomal protein L16/L10AE